jgi:hypothetical protein
MTHRVEQDQSELSMVRESPGSGVDLSPDERRSWGDRRVKQDDMALDNEQVIRQAPRRRISSRSVHTYRRYRP